MQFLPVLLLCLVPLSYQQCLTPEDEVRRVSDVAHQGLLHGELLFSTDILRAVASNTPSGNVFFSPSSIFQTLLIAYFTAANHTAASLKKALHLPPDQDKLDIVGAYNLENYYQKLRSIKGEDDYQLSNANRIYYAKQLKVQHCMKVLFADEMQPANFLENLDGVVKKINNWVSTQTRQVLQNFLSKDSVSIDTQLVLVNAAYFKGTWKKQFDPELTYKDKFNTYNGNQTKVAMMTIEDEFNLRVDEKIGAEILELPYTGDEISMYIFLPLKNSASALQDMLGKVDGEVLQGLVEAMNAESNLFKLSVSIPKFTVEKSLDLMPILESLKVGDLFESTADLSTLTGTAGMGFSEAIHKAKIRVDEKGSEAAAATALISSRMGVPTFIANRPFAYTIHHKANNVLLFFGMFNSP